ncbi:hypothetical protein phytr_4230 [Candidatus Phycorickettsia trachydisci]|uniref:Glycosyltransferase 61 catalytic domain-containing protein n=1 Tax=Candidatus Phycorickettsia trachydisci TaxID=2115978 RepID=A0A2P1P7Y1_9RICK|nr:glycosyltransferase 61 family protein [Candidatus Phycorickettsia trachydisci]AVP87373.1 hypothetical protein phytr_4230 [Candidatus Phycorickettsia trachydisci]
MQATPLEDLKTQGLLTSSELPDIIKEEITKLEPSNKKQPANLDKSDLEPETILYTKDLLFVAQLPEGIVVNDGKILTKDCVIIKDTQTSPENDQIKLRELDEKFLYYNGRLAVISSPGSENWYHWLVQVLPRLAILKESKIEYDHIYINGLEEWHKTSLKKFLSCNGINEEKLLIINEDCIIKARELIVPSVPHIPCKGHHGLSWLEETLEGVFLKDDTECETYDKIYISRANASSRKIINEEEIKCKLEDLDFEILYLEKLSPEVQAKIFAHAKIIAGPHGSGFANLIFAEPGFKLIEIDYEKERSYFKEMTEQLGGQYELYHVKSEDISENADPEKDPNMKLCDDFFIRLSGHLGEINT